MNCLQEECGLAHFGGSLPDQWYRFILAIFLHSGVVQLVLVLLLQITIAVNVEKVAGCIRVGIIYLISGTGGYAVSTLFQRYTITCGASGACFGIIGALVRTKAPDWLDLLAWQPCYDS